jgi:hypothetical protein
VSSRQRSPLGVSELLCQYHPAAKVILDAQRTWNENSTSKEFEKAISEAIRQIISDYPHAGNLEHSQTYNGLCKDFGRLLRERSEDFAKFPYCLFTLYFGNAYFGLQQAIEFDSIRYAIDQTLGRTSQSRWVALSCLMHAASYCTPGPGHFAQFRALNSVAVCEDILRYRNRSPKAYLGERRVRETRAPRKSTPDPWKIIKRPR